MMFKEDGLSYDIFRLGVLERRSETRLIHGRYDRTYCAFLEE